MSKPSDEKYTPESELIKVRKALGGQITLDPCWHPNSLTNPVYAYTEECSCLVNNWGSKLYWGYKRKLHGLSSIFLNPPFSEAKPFLEKLCSELDRYGNNTDISAITLTLVGVVNNKGTQHLLKKYAVGGCNPHGRINFVNGGKSNDRDVVYTLWGNPDYYDRFKDAFQDGLCYKY